MKYICGFTFGFMSPRGSFESDQARESLRLMKEGTGSDTVIMTLAALQDTPHSVHIDYTGEHIVSDEELLLMIDYAKSLGMRIIIKPTVNVRNGTWRAHINFFDHDVPCEPKWHEWFASYTEYQMHYARIAEQCGAEMLIVGCEMVQTERRAAEWRELIKQVKTVYNGLVSYNTDKYQEGHVSWWDAVDVISSSGYYPIDDWDRQLDRIEQVVRKYNKPFFFAEAGCPSRKGSAMIPNNWEHGGEVDVDEQARFYQMMFEKVETRDWVEGFGMWDWKPDLYSKEEAHLNSDYCVYGKPAELIIYNAYTKNQSK